MRVVREGDPSPMVDGFRSERTPRLETVPAADYKVFAGGSCPLEGR